MFFCIITGDSGAALTNGIEIYITDASGHADFSVKTDHDRFATLPVPSGYKCTNEWYCRVDNSLAIPHTISFGLGADPNRAANTFTFVHISDTQTTSTLSYPLAADIAEFVANTGISLIRVRTLRNGIITVSRFPNPSGKFPFGGTDEDASATRVWLRKFRGATGSGRANFEW